MSVKTIYCPETGDRVRLILPGWPDMDGKKGTVVGVGKNGRWIIEPDGMEDFPLHLLTADFVRIESWF